MWAVAGGEGVRDTVQGIAVSNDQIVMALIALVGTSIAALVFVIRNGRLAQTAADDAAIAARQATAANSAVNNVGPGKHNLYDMVERIHDDVVELKGDQDQYDSHGWETLPPDINTAVGLTTTIRDLQNNHKAVNEKLDMILVELRDHTHGHAHAG
jgi:hypothetical protein